MTLIVIAMVAAAGAYGAVSLQRAFFYARPGPMPSLVPKDLNGTLEELESVLKEKAPEVLESLRPGLSEEQIAGVERRYGLRLTEELRTLYRWRDGQPRATKQDLIPSGRFVPLEEAAETRAMLRSQRWIGGPVQIMVGWVFAGHRAGWLDVVVDGAGAGYYYDPGRRRSPGHFFYHFDEDRFYRFYPNVANFFAAVVECYEDGHHRPGSVPRERDIEATWEVHSRYGTCTNV